MPPARKSKGAIPSTSSATTPSTPSTSAFPPSLSLSSSATSSRPSRARQDSTASAALSELTMADSHSHTNTDNTNDLASNGVAQWTEPPWVGFLETTEDALLILEAARKRLIPRVTRRLADRERRLIQSGSVFVFEEEESGIKRWTDGFLWSPSRILGNFLLYRETDKRNPDGTPATRPGRSNTGSSALSNSNAHQASSLLVSEEPTASSPTALTSGSLSRPREEVLGPGGYSAAGSSGLDRARERILLGSLTNSQKFKEDGMMKKTFSLTLAGTNKTHHLVSYYKVSDVEAGRLRTPSSLPEFAALEISSEFLDKTHFRVQPRVEVGEDGRVRFRGETADETDSPGESPQDLPPPSHPHHSHPPGGAGGSGSNIHPHHPGSNHHSGGGGSHNHHPYHPRPSSTYSSSSTAQGNYTQQQAGYGGHPNYYTNAVPVNGQVGVNHHHPYAHHGHSRHNSTSDALAAAAKAQAEASQRMYINGAAVAASTTSSTGSGRSFQGQAQQGQAQQGQAFYPNGSSMSSTNGVGSTASSLGLHYPSALNNGAAPAYCGANVGFTQSPTGSSTSSSALGFKSRSSSIMYSPSELVSSSASSAPMPSSASVSSTHSHSRGTNNINYNNPAYLSDNSTGAPPFQAPQLYNPKQPSAAANSAFATTSYPASLAPGMRNSNNGYASATPSVRSGSVSMSVVSGMDDLGNGTMAGIPLVSNTHGAHGGPNRVGRSGSRGSDSSSANSGSSGPGSLSSTMVSTSASSEVATPSLASSRRSSAAAAGFQRPDPRTLEKILAQKAEQQQQQQQQAALQAEVAVVDGDAYPDIDMSAIDITGMNMVGGFQNYFAMDMGGINGSVSVGNGMMGMDDLNMGFDGMIMSPTDPITSVSAATTGDDPQNQGAWCTSSTTGYNDISGASSVSASYVSNNGGFVDSPLTQSPSHTASSGAAAAYFAAPSAGGYSIPPPPSRQKSLPATTASYHSHSHSHHAPQPQHSFSSWGYDDTAAAAAYYQQQQQLVTSPVDGAPGFGMDQ